MYAVIKSGGKQYRVKQGDKLKLETLPAEVGAVVNLDEVLMIGEGQTIKVGRPSLAGAKVLATVISHGRHDKIHVIKFRRRKHHEKWQGHRQNYTEVQITEIQG